LRPGEAVALVGPNAAGKSTLVRALAGLLPLAAGEAPLLGRPLAAWSPDALARAVAPVTPQEGGAEALTVLDPVAPGRDPHGRSPPPGPFGPFGAAGRAASARAVEQTGTRRLAGRRIGTLSAGERQLATLARGLAQEPRVLLLDEPAAHLDVGHQLRLYRVLDEVRPRGVAVLAVVHDLQRAAAWAERMLLLAGGRLVAEGPPDAVLGSEAAARAVEVRVRGRGRGPGGPGARASPLFIRGDVMKVVSLLPAATEIVCALGLRDRLVGRSHECDFPEDVDALPALTKARVDSSLPSAALDAEVRRIVADRLPIYMLDEARLSALAPDVVVTQEACEVCAISFDQVVGSLRRTASRAAVVSLQPRSLGDVLADVETVAAACGRAARGKELANALRMRLDALLARADAAKAPRVAVVEWLAPPMLARPWGPGAIAAPGGSPPGPAAGEPAAPRGQGRGRRP